MAYTGEAVYDMFANELGESISDQISLIAPLETQFLDEIGDSDEPVLNKAHVWMEDSMLPRTYSNTTVIASTAAATVIAMVTNGKFLRINDILEVAGTSEQLFVTSVTTTGASITVSRGYAGTLAQSAAAAEVIAFRGSAMTEGAGPRKQRRTPRVPKTNYVQIFREDIDTSTLANNAIQRPENAPQPYDDDVTKKTREVLIQLENAAMMGRTNGNTIGADDTETTMAGVYHSVATNITSHGTFSNSIINEMLAEVNNFTDLRAHSNMYTLFCGDKAFRLISNSRVSRVTEDVGDVEAGIAPAQVYWTDYGAMRIRYVRSLPTGSVVALRKDLVNVKPYRGNSFATRDFDNGSLTKTGYVAGTYTVEFMSEAHSGRLDGLAA